jgi:hypothetical protein
MSTASPPFPHQDKDSAGAALLFQLESGLDMPLSDTLIDTFLVPGAQKSSKTEGERSSAFAPDQPENTVRNIFRKMRPLLFRRPPKFYPLRLEHY